MFPRTNGQLFAAWPGLIRQGDQPPAQNPSPSLRGGEQGMRVRDIMTTPVVRVHPDTKVRDCVRIMVEQKVDGLPIVDDQNRVVGILTFADLLRKGRRQHPRALDFFLYLTVVDDQDEAVRERLAHLVEQPASQVCTHNVIACGPDDDPFEVAGLMVDYRIKRVPVLSEHGTLIGIISRGDVIRAIWREYSQQA